MKIGKPTISIVEDQVEVSAPIEQSAGTQYPDRLWFRYPREFEKDLDPTRVDGFIVGLMVFAWLEKENIEADGAFSPRVAAGIEEWNKFLNKWEPDRAFDIDFKPSSFEPHEVIPDRKRVIGTFSGGADSLYMLKQLHHENQKVPGSRMTDAMFIAGFEIPIRSMPTYERYRKEYADALPELGVNLLSVATNLRDFYPNNKFFKYAHGVVIFGAALNLYRVCPRLYIAASGWLGENIIGWGTSPVADYLFSSEALHMFHHSYTVSRQKKLEELSDWKFAQEHIRVCWYHPPNGINCGYCYKCARTMVDLDVYGKLEKFKTFPEERRKGLYRRATYPPHLINKADAIGRMAWKRGRKKIALKLIVVWIKDTFIRYPKQGLAQLFGVKPRID